MADDQPPRVSVPTLVIVGGPLDGTTYPLALTGRDLAVGSSLDADVQILLGNVEPVHALVSFGSAGLVIADAGSATGVFLNGEKVEGEQPLQDGDRVYLGPPGAKGSARLLVLMPGGTASRSAEADAGGEPAPAFDRDAEAPALEGGSPSLVLEADTPEAAEAPSLVLESGDEGAGDGAEAPQEIDLGLGSVPKAEGPVVDETGVGPPLGAEELGPVEEDGDLLFAEPLSPLPVPPPAPAAPPPPPPVAAPPPPPPAAAPPPPPPAAAPPPPPPAPPSRAAQERLTAPPPPEPRVPRPGAPRPEYQSELPSIPVETPPSPAPGRAEGFPPLRPAPAGPAARPAAKARGRRRRSPSIPLLPLVGGLGALAVVGALGWFSFLRPTPPEIASIVPDKAEPGQTITVTGKHLVAGGGSTVLFGDQAGQVAAATSKELKIVVPTGIKDQAPVVVQTKHGRSNPMSFVAIAIPSVMALEPDVAMPGQMILIRGENLSGPRLAVEFGGMAAAAVEPAPEGVRAAVPDLRLPEGSKTSVTVRVGDKTTKALEFLVGRLPLVFEAKPSSSGVGDRVVLVGRGFLPGASANAVTFAGQPALVLSASPTELGVVAPAPPAGEIQPEVPVVVTAGGRASSPFNFSLARSSTSGYLPRFFAAPVAEHADGGFVFVSTELGPVLLLGGKADAASPAERAFRLAASLNALVAGAASKPPSFELRERPEPAVAVVGDVRPFLVPTAEDAAAYSRNWETGRGAGPKVSPAALARHWAALLQDYLGLFLYRQRPLKMPALSPHGRILTEIYAEASRRSPDGTSVPARLVLPTPTSMATMLRRMALVVSGATGQAAVAVVGRWSGTIEDPELGTRRFEVELGTEGGRLKGTLTTWSGDVAVRSPLRNIGFDRGNVRFTGDLQGAANEFRGTLDGNKVTGTIERPGKAKAPFELQFVE